MGIGELGLEMKALAYVPADPHPALGLLPEVPHHDLVRQTKDGVTPALPCCEGKGHAPSRPRNPVVGPICSV